MADFEKIIVDTLRGKVPDRAIPWIVGQSAHETAGWKSNVFKRNNNAFGMVHPRRRQTTSLGPGPARQPGSEGGSAYASYSDVAQSTEDLVLWLKYNKINWDNINTAEDYVKWIKSKNYFTAPLEKYTNSVLKWIKQLNTKVPVAVPMVGISLLLIAVLFYLNRGSA